MQVQGGKLFPVSQTVNYFLLWFVLFFYFWETNCCDEME